MDIAKVVIGTLKGIKNRDPKEVLIAFFGTSAEYFTGALAGKLAACYLPVLAARALPILAARSLPVLAASFLSVLLSPIGC